MPNVTESFLYKTPCSTEITFSDFSVPMSEASSSMEFPLEGLTGRPIGYEDATWILTSAFIIFTMQSGFGLIESGQYFLIKQMKFIKKVR